MKPMPFPPVDAPLRDRVRTYYRTVSRYIEQELARRRDRDFWRELAEDADAGGVLELGCGTGRVMEALVRGAGDAGPVVGVDLSPEMLRRARERLGSHPATSLVMADMRTLPFARSFRLVVAADDPFVHLLTESDRRAALRAVARLLEPEEGLFVLDAHWLGETRWRKSLTPRGFRRERTLPCDDSELRIEEEWHCDGETRRCAVRYEYRQDDREPERAEFEARLWSLDEVRHRMAEAGLQIRAIWGDYEKNPFDPQDARHLVVTAVKAGPDTLRAT